MNSLRTLTRLAIPLALVVSVTSAEAQQKPLKEQVAGVWTLVSGSQIGADANGLLILDSSGHMSMQIIRPGRPKFASNSRMQGTADENKGSVQGMISYFGRYTVSEANKTHHLSDRAQLVPQLGCDRTKTAVHRHRGRVEIHQSSALKRRCARAARMETQRSSDQAGGDS